MGRKAARCRDSQSSPVGGGRRLRKAIVFISSNGLASRLQQVFLLAAGFQRGYIGFREQVHVLCGGVGFGVFFNS